MKKSLLQSRFQQPCFWHLTFTSWIYLRTFQFPLFQIGAKDIPARWPASDATAHQKIFLPWWHSKNQSNQSSLHTLFNSANRSPQLVNRKLCLLQKESYCFYKVSRWSLHCEWNTSVLSLLKWDTTNSIGAVVWPTLDIYYWKHEQNSVILKSMTIYCA